MADEDVLLSGLDELTAAVKTDELFIEDDPSGTPDDNRITVNNLLKTSVDYRDFEEGAAPAAPASNTGRIYFKTDGLAYSKDDAGTETLLSGGLGASSNLLCEGRLTPTSGTAVDTADRTGVTSLYFTPFEGNKARVFTGSIWEMRTITEKQIKLTDADQTGNTTNGSPTLSGLTDTSHWVVGGGIAGIGIPGSTTIAAIIDGTSVTMSANATADGTGITVTYTDPTASMFALYLYDDSGTLKIEKEKWTNATTRATALTTQDGIYVKTGDTGKLHIGDYYTNAAGQTTWSYRYRLIKNRHNQRKFKFYTVQGVGYALSSATYIQENSSANSTIYGVFYTGEMVHLQTDGTCIHNTGSSGLVLYEQGIGIDSTSVTSSIVNLPGSDDATATTLRSRSMSYYEGVLTEGYHYIAGLAKYSGAGSSIYVQIPMLREMTGFWG